MVMLIVPDLTMLYFNAVSWTVLDWAYKFFVPLVCQIEGAVLELISTLLVVHVGCICVVVWATPRV